MGQLLVYLSTIVALSFPFVEILSRNSESLFFVMGFHHIRVCILFRNLSEKSFKIMPIMFDS